MERIQDGEMDQFKDLDRLLEMELKFAENCVETLKEIKVDWPDRYEWISFSAACLTIYQQRSL
jgi:hypothetical protein